MRVARKRKGRPAKKPRKASLRGRASDGAANQTLFSKTYEKAVLRTAISLALKGEKRIT